MQNSVKSSWLSFLLGFCRHVPFDPYLDSAVPLTSTVDFFTTWVPGGTLENDHVKSLRKETVWGRNVPLAPTVDFFTTWIPSGTLETHHVKSLRKETVWGRKVPLTPTVDFFTTWVPGGTLETHHVKSLRKETVWAECTLGPTIDFFTACIQRRHCEISMRNCPAITTMSEVAAFAITSMESLEFR